MLQHQSGWKLRIVKASLIKTKYICRTKRNTTKIPKLIEEIVNSLLNTSVFSTKMSTKTQLWRFPPFLLHKISGKERDEEAELAPRQWGSPPAITTWVAGTQKDKLSIWIDLHHHPAVSSQLPAETPERKEGLLSYLNKPGKSNGAGALTLPRNSGVWLPSKGQWRASREPGLQAQSVIKWQGSIEETEKESIGVDKKTLPVGLERRLSG